MAIFEHNGKRALFIHIPKCGGTSVSDFLRRHGEERFDRKMSVYGKTFRPRHLAADVLQQIYFAGMFDYAFAVVRHPTSRIISEFTYQGRKSTPRWQKMLGFDRWLKLSLGRAARDPSYRENHFRPQTDFLAFDCEVFRMEDGMDRVAARLIEVMGLTGEAAMPKLNTSRKRTAFGLTADQSDRIASAYASDFEAFGYDTAPAAEGPHR